jgi:single-strand DNA-binding protein
MAYSLNKITILGTVGKDAEFKPDQDNTQRLCFMVATSENWVDKSTGQKQEKTEWHKVVIFNEKIISYAKDLIKKGTRVYVEGQVQTRKWTDQNNVERFTVEVVVPRFKGELIILKSAEQDGNIGNTYKKPLNVQKKLQSAIVLDDDIPF